MYDGEALICSKASYDKTPISANSMSSCLDWFWKYNLFVTCHWTTSIQVFIFAAATTTLLKPSMYHRTTTSIEFVETTLESRTQPVATEHAVPTSTQTHLPLVIGKNQLPQYCYYHRVCVHRVQTPISAYTTYIMKAHSSCHGQCTSPICQKGRWVLFQVFSNLSMKEHYVCLQWNTVR